MAQTNLDSVQDYVADVRRILLDKVQPYRYPDDDVVQAFNIALNEAFRLRPDLFIGRKGRDVPQYENVSGEIVPIERPFQLAFVYGTAAHVLLRDEEDVQDARANTFLEKFNDVLVGVRISPIRGGTPAPKKQG